MVSSTVLGSTAAKQKTPKQTDTRGPRHARHEKPRQGKQGRTDCGGSEPVLRMYLDFLVDISGLVG